jgi:hypothetical protein
VQLVKQIEEDFGRAEKIQEDIPIAFQSSGRPIFWQQRHKQTNAGGM